MLSTLNWWYFVLYRRLWQICIQEDGKRKINISLLQIDQTWTNASPRWVIKQSYSLLILSVNKWRSDNWEMSKRSRAGFSNCQVTSLNHRKIYTCHNIINLPLCEEAMNSRRLDFQWNDPEYFEEAEESWRREESKSWIARIVQGRREYLSPYMTYVPAENKRNIPGGDGTIWAGLSHWCTRAVVRVKTKK